MTGQQYYQQFGKNRIQYQDFDWFYFEADNFEVYYHNREQNFAEMATEILQEEYKRITDIIGYAPYSKVKILIYSSYRNLHQSNIGVRDKLFSEEGQANSGKLLVEVPYPGKKSEFRQEIVYRLTKVLINDMMFGGSIRDVLQNTLSGSLPSWFVEGVARYIAYGWDVDMDDYTRDLISRRNVKNLSRLRNEDAAIVGQSVWNFLVLKHGKSNISNILNLTRIVRNEEKGISHSLGLPYKQFIYEWQTYYMSAYDEIKDLYVPLNTKHQIERNRNLRVKYSSNRISPNGELLAYVKNDEGRFEVILRYLAIKSPEDVVVKGGRRAINQEVDYSLPLLEWIDNENLAVVQSQNGQMVLTIHNLINRKKFRRVLYKFTQVKAISFNSNGKLAILSGTVGDRNDLFLMSISRRAVKRLTNDDFDDLDPHFVPGTNRILFSSNRGKLFRKDSLKIPNVDENDIFNIYMLDLDNENQPITKITNNISKERSPIAVNKNEFYYLSDQMGIYNIFHYDLQDSLSKQVTRFEKSIKDFDIHRQSLLYTFVALDNRTDKLFIEEGNKLIENNFAPHTLRQKVKQALISRKRASDLINKPPLVLSDTSASDIFVKTEGDLIGADRSANIKSLDSVIDVKDFVFEEEIESKKSVDPNKSYSFLATLRNRDNEKNLGGPYKYETRFSTDNYNVTPVIDPLRGFGTFVELQLNDMLENHKFYSGIYLKLGRLPNLQGDFMGEYKYLKKRLDYHVRYKRRTILIQPTGITGTSLPLNSLDTRQKYVLSRLTGGVTYPISPTRKIEANIFGMDASYLDLKISEGLDSAGIDLPNPVFESQKYYFGYSVSYTLDDVIPAGPNMLFGTQFKLEYSNSIGLNDSRIGFGSIKVDGRRYFKITKHIIWANKVFYGRSFGASPNSFIIGGTSNWLLTNRTEELGDNSYLQGRHFEETPNNDPLTFENGKDNSRILFAEFVPSLRGYSYNELNGQNAIVLNSEIRIPLFRMLTTDYIPANFIRNFVAVGFIDFGSAWTGKSPFNRVNGVNTQPFPATNFQANLRSSRDSWLTGVGYGFHTTLLGYHLRFDFARPYESNNFRSGRFYVSLGFDF